MPAHPIPYHMWAPADSLCYAMQHFHLCPVETKRRTVAFEIQGTIPSTTALAQIGLQEAR